MINWLRKKLATRAFYRLILDGDRLGEDDLFILANLSVLRINQQTESVFEIRYVGDEVTE